MKKCICLLLLLVCTISSAQTKISTLPLGSAAGTLSADSFPYVENSDLVTKRLTIWDIINLPPMQAQFSLLIPSQSGNSGKYLTTNGSATSWGSPVTSVGLTDASTTPIYTITNSPVTSSGAISFALATQGANTVFSGPPSGSATQPTFRSLVSLDIPNNAANTTGTAAGLSTTLAIASGGTGQTSAGAAFNALSPLTTLGDVPYYSTTNTRLAGNTTTTKKFLTQTGNGSVSAAPAWGTIQTTDVPTLNQNTTGTAGNITASSNTSLTTLSNLTSIGTIATGIWNGSGVTVPYGGTGNGTFTANQIVLGGTTSTGALAQVATGTSGFILQSNGSSAPTWVSPMAATGNTTTSQTLPYSVPSTNYNVIISGASGNVTLPDATVYTTGNITLIHGGTALTNKYTILGTSSQGIVGPSGTIASGSYLLTTTGEGLVLTSNGTNWQVVQHYTNTGAISGGTIALSATSAYVFTWSGNQNIVLGDTYSDGAGNIFTVSTSTNTTTGTFSGTPGTPASTGTLTRVTGSGVSSVSWTSRTTTGQPIFGSALTKTYTIYRNGRFALLNMILAQNGAGTAGSGDYIFYFPANLLADTSIITAYPTAPGTTLIGVTAATVASLPLYGIITDGTATIGLNNAAFLYSAGSFRMGNIAESSSAFAGGNLGGAYFSLGNANIGINVIMTFPVSDWQP